MSTKLARTKRTNVEPVFRVHSVNTGAEVCGPYSDRKTADRECERLNREAAQGRTAPSEAHPRGQELAGPGDARLMHGAVPQAYEVKSGEGIIL